MIAPTVTTDRLILKPLTLGLFEEQHAFMSDPRVMAFIGVGGKPRSRTESWMKYCLGAGLWSIMGYGYWAFTDRASGKMIGMGGLGNFERGIDQLVGYPEAGWAFAADVWGKGFASEAIAAVVSWADANLNAPEVRCIISPQNAPSIRVAEKNGFTQIDEVENELGVSLVFSRLRHLEGEGSAQGVL